MTNFTEFTFSSKDGIHQCNVSLWTPEGEPRAVVQIVHGVAEYAGRYDRFARYLADHGFVVCGEDHLGHGKTVDDGKYGYFGKKDGWTLVTSDVRKLRVLMGEKYPNIPYFLLGHSMGSFLARTYLCAYPGTVDGCILSGTGQEKPALVAAGKAVASAICAARGPETVSPLINKLSLGAYNDQFKRLSERPVLYLYAHRRDVPGDDVRIAVHFQRGGTVPDGPGHAGLPALRRP